MGRGCGGRASSRRTRSQPNLVVNHGTPSFDVRTDRGREIVKHLESKGFVKEYKGIRGILSAEEGFKKSPVESGTHFVGCSPDGGGGMNGVCEGLLADSQSGEPYFMPLPYHGAYPCSETTRRTRRTSMAGPFSTRTACPWEETSKIKKAVGPLTLIGSL